MSRMMSYPVTVKEVESIEGKDKIGLASFVENGYKVIVDKNTIKPGMVVVYFEVDSLLPASNPNFEFLRKRCYKEKYNAHLITQMKMCGLYSTGLVLTFEEAGIKPYKPGKDLSDILKIEKYEPEEDKTPTNQKQLSGWKKCLKQFLLKHTLTRWLGKRLFLIKKIRGDFPIQYISKSDESNLMNHTDWFNKYRNEPCYATQKLEGQSVTVFLYNADTKKKRFLYSIFGRNSVARDEHYIYFKKMDMEKKLRDLQKEMQFNSIAIQGEFCGPGIQNDIYKKGQHFNVYKINIDTKTVSFEKMQELCKKLNLDIVPIIKIYPMGFGVEFNSADEIQEYSEHLWFKIGENMIKTYNDIEVKNLPKKKNKEYHRAEGVVFSSLENKSNWSFKVKSMSYQLEGF